jgi:hypothetical protein
LNSWVENGNVLTPEAISQDLKGNLYALWVDADYTLKLSRSRDGASWTKPVIVSVPTNSTTPMMAYHPIITHHPKDDGRAGLAYYGSPDGGKSWNAYIAETHNIATDFPIFTGIVANELSQPMQHNIDGRWDQGYQDPFADLVEFIGLRYHPKTDELVGAFARKMCRKPSVMGRTFDATSCIEGWDYKKRSSSQWQGYVAFARR